MMIGNLTYNQRIKIRCYKIGRTYGSNIFITLAIILTLNNFSTLKLLFRNPLNKQIHPRKDKKHRTTHRKPRRLHLESFIKPSS